MSSRVKKRISITLTNEILEDLEIWAEQRGQTVSTLAAHLVEQAVLEAQISTVKLDQEASLTLRELAKQRGLTPAAYAQKILLNGIEQAAQSIENS